MNIRDKMKKVGIVVALILGLTFFVGCSEEEVLPEDQQAEVIMIDETEETPEVGSNKPNGTDVDFDLTTMSDTMVYAQVYDYMTKAGDYVGMTFRMEGTFEVAQLEDGSDVYYVVINDATGCCPQGLGIKFSKETESPQHGDVIRATGTVETEDINGETYAYILVDSMQVTN